MALPLYISLSTTFFLNLVVVAPPVDQWMDRWVYAEFGVFVSLINTGLLIGCTAMLAAGLFTPGSSEPASGARSETVPLGAT